MPEIDIDGIARYLKAHLPPERFRHVLGTCRTALDLAARHGVSLRKAAIAALLHDTAKDMTAQAMKRYIRRHRVSVPDRHLLARCAPELLHGFVGAAIARHRFDIRDREFLHAIAFHTIGAPRMGKLSKIIYLADAVGSDRHYRGVERLRRLARRDLDAAFLEVAAGKIAHVLTARRWLYPGAVAVWNATVRE